MNNSHFGIYNGLDWFKTKDFYSMGAISFNSVLCLPLHSSTMCYFVRCIQGIHPELYIILLNYLETKHNAVVLSDRM